MATTADLRHDYDRRAQQHRPTDPAAIAAEVHRLHAGGLTAQDIAAEALDSAAQLAEIIQQRRAAERLQ